MTSWTKELDDAIVLATSSGRYHVVLFYQLCALAALPTAFLAFSQVFTSATPDHWCSPPPELLSLNLSVQELKHLSIPRTPDGERYDSCRMYDINIVRLYREFPGHIQDSSQIHVEKGLLKIVKVKQFALNSDDRRPHDLELMSARIHNGSWPVVPCQYGWTFDKQYYDRTLVTDFKLVCDLSWWPRTSTTLFWVGSIFGNVLFGWLSDRYGRRPTILLMIFVEVPLAIITSFSTDYITYTILRVAGGLFFPALYQMPFILALELMPPKRRTYTGMIIGMLFASGMCALALLAYLLRDWFALSLATSAPFLVLYSYYWLIPESPRWLVGRGRIAEAEKVLRKMAKANGIDLKHGFLLKLHREVKDSESMDLGLVMLPQHHNARIPGFPEAQLEESKYIDRRISNMQTFKPDLNKIPEVEIETPKTTDMERVIAFEVAEIVNKKSRLKKNREQPSKEEKALIGEKEIYATEQSLNAIAESVESSEEIHEESRNKTNAQYTQTDPYTKSPSNTLRRKSIQFVNKILGKEDMSDIEINFDEEIDNKMDDQCSEGDCVASPLDLFKFPNIRKKFLILTFDWIANAVVYNSLSYNSSNLGVNDFLAFFIGGAVELPAYIIAWKSMDRFGRRWVLCVTMFIGGLACLSCVLVPEGLRRIIIKYYDPWVTVSLAMVGRLCVAASFAVFYVFVGELLPTVLRAQAMASASFLSGLGLLACPYIVHLAVYVRVLPLAIMGTLSLAGSIASLFLPETLHQPLPQTTRDGEEFGSEFSILSCPVRRRKD